MSQHTARHDQHVRSEDEDEDVAQARQRERGQGARPRPPVGLTPPGDDGVGPDEPDAGEFELIGDNDLGAADLGPAAPDARDPDADSGQMRKISR
jgi:hypothetical protein